MLESESSYNRQNLNGLESESLTIRFRNPNGLSLPFMTSYKYGEFPTPSLSRHVLLIPKYVISGRFTVFLLLSLTKQLNTHTHTHTHTYTHTHSPFTQTHPHPHTHTKNLNYYANVASSK